EQVMVRKKVEDSFHGSFTRELPRDSLVMPIALGRALVLKSEAGGPAIDRERHHGVVVLGVSASGQLVARADLRLGEPKDLQPGPQQGKANVIELDRVQQLELAVCGAAGSRERDEALPRTLQ